MLPKINPTTTKSWKKLSEHFEEMRRVQILDLFMDDPDRFRKYSLSVPEIVCDFSKNIINENTIQLLLQLAEECGLRQAINAMFAGEKINETEDRSVLHTALRNFSDKPVFSEGSNVMPDVRKVRDQMKNFCLNVHSGNWKGYSGKKIRYFVNIGIGN
jgi:glucose-6-phosphate isomerase